MLPLLKQHESGLGDGETIFIAVRFDGQNALSEHTSGSQCSFEKMFPNNQPREMLDRSYPKLWRLDQSGEKQILSHGGGFFRLRGILLDVFVRGGRESQ